LRSIRRPGYRDVHAVVKFYRVVTLISTYRAITNERAQNINSAGGYLRALTEKARAGEFSVGPMLMAALKANGVQPQLVTAT